MVIVSSKSGYAYYVSIQIKHSMRIQLANAIGFLFGNLSSAVFIPPFYKLFFSLHSLHLYIDIINQRVTECRELFEACRERIFSTFSPYS